MRSRICLAVMLTVAAAFGFLKSYEVMPVKAAWSAYADGDVAYGIAQTITANFDSVSEVQLFVGSRGATPTAEYLAEVQNDDGNVVAFNGGEQASQDHIWLKFPLTTVSGQKFTRGKQYLVKFTRPGDSLQFYYQDFSPYAYGEIQPPGGDQPPPVPVTADLCMRLFGKARVGDEFAVQSVVAWPDASRPYIVHDTANWAACISRESDIGVKYDKIGYGFWNTIQPYQNEWHWGWLDSLVALYAAGGVHVTMNAGGSNPWSSSEKRGHNTN